MAIIFIVSAVLHTTALTGKAGAWNMVAGKRYRRRATCAGMYAYRLEPNGLQRQRWALQQRAFSRMLAPFLSFLYFIQCIGDIGRGR